MKWFWLFFTGLLISICGIALNAYIGYYDGGLLVFGTLTGTFIILLALKGADEDSK